jgi:hypothetical protein
MASQGDVHIVTCNIGALSNDYRPIFKVPTGWGGITILNASYVTESAGTSSVSIVNAGTAGTGIVAGGTLFAGGSVAASAGVPLDMTVADTAFIDDGYWVAVKEGSIGTTGAITIVSLSYLMGK